MPNAYTELTTCSAHKSVFTVILKFVNKYKRSVSHRNVKLSVNLAVYWVTMDYRLATRNFQSNGICFKFSGLIRLGRGNFRSACNGICLKF